MRILNRCPGHIARLGVALVAIACLVAPIGSRGAAQRGSASCAPATPAAASSPAASPSPQSSPAPGTPPTAGVAETTVRFGETDALLWRAGDYGVILSHGAAYDAASWQPQAEAISAAGMTVLALEQTSPEDILAAVRFLDQECGVAGVALIGASAGASSALSAAAIEPGVIDQLIILSGTGDVAGLGDQPKLFVASEEEGLADATLLMAEDAPGPDNEALLLPGNAHAQAIFETDQGDELLRVILDRLATYGTDAP